MNVVTVPQRNKTVFEAKQDALQQRIAQDNADKFGRRKEIKARLREIRDAITTLEKERTILYKEFRGTNAKKDKKTKVMVVKPTPYISLYALELEDGKYYVGITANVQKRYRKHCNGKGAQWTKQYKPVKILEERTTTFTHIDDATALENALTFEYARKYGSDNVRGGGYCQSKPKWPISILNADRERKGVIEIQNQRDIIKALSWIN